MSNELIIVFCSVDRSLIITWSKQRWIDSTFLPCGQTSEVWMKHKFSFEKFPLFLSVSLSSLSILVITSMWIVWGEKNNHLISIEIRLHTVHFLQLISMSFTGVHESNKWNLLVFVPIEQICFLFISQTRSDHLTHTNTLLMILFRRYSIASFRHEIVDQRTECEHLLLIDQQRAVEAKAISTSALSINHVLSRCLENVAQDKQRRSTYANRYCHGAWMGMCLTVGTARGEPFCPSLCPSQRSFHCRLLLFGWRRFLVLRSTLRNNDRWNTLILRRVSCSFLCPTLLMWGVVIVIRIGRC